VLSRRVTEGQTGVAGRAPHVELAPVPRGVLVRAAAGCTAWVSPIDNADSERHEVSGRGRIIPSNGWMVFFEEPTSPSASPSSEGPHEGAEISGGVAATLRVKSTNGALHVAALP
jgi:hypothetical protein